MLPTPNYTRIPNIILDEHMAALTPAELACILYICRRTDGFHRHADAISIEQFSTGIKTADGRVIDGGTGLSAATVKRALKSLEERGLIVRDRRTRKSGGSAPTVYALATSNDSDGGSPVSQGGWLKLSQGVAQNEPPGGLTSEPHKKKVFRKKDSEDDENEVEHELGIDMHGDSWLNERVLPVKYKIKKREDRDLVRAVLDMDIPNAFARREAVLEAVRGAGPGKAGEAALAMCRSINGRPELFPKRSNKAQELREGGKSPAGSRETKDERVQRELAEWVEE